MIVGRAVDVIVASNAVRSPAIEMATIIAQNRMPLRVVGVDLVGISLLGLPSLGESIGVGVVGGLSILTKQHDNVHLVVDCFF